MKNISEKMKYVVTGGAGFIGSHLTQELVDQGEEVTVIDDLSTGNQQRLKNISDKIRIVKGDIRDLEFLKKEFKGVDFVLHQAALISVPESIEKKELYKEVNVTGTGNVLEAARTNKVKRVIFSSSAAVYGDTESLPVKESTELKPLSPYAEFKIKGEQMCAEYYQKHGLKTIVLRYFNVFGPEQDPESEYAVVIPLFIKKVLENKSPIIYGDGDQTRDFIYIRNIVHANMLTLKTDNQEAFGNPINIGSGQEISINQLLRLVNKNLGKKIEPEFSPEREGDIRHSCSDISKAKELLGYGNKYSFEQGLKETIEWFKNIY